MFSRLVISLLLLLMSASITAEDQSSPSLYRNFWYPDYHGKRLAYCFLTGKCGAPVASCYCKEMGYEKAVQSIPEYNVGYTNFINTRAECQGWRCNGFKLIRCTAKMNHDPLPNYYYRKQRFDFPRFEHYRVDWCYKDNKGCGHRAAYSYCRRLGYSNTKGFKKDPHIAATKTLGDEKLCFGKSCNSFKYIICYR